MGQTIVSIWAGLVFVMFFFSTASWAAGSAAVIPLFSSQKSVATGTAISGTSRGGKGVYGYTEDGYAVRGEDSGTVEGKGYGGHFTSNTGVGVYGGSTASPSTSNAYVPGVYGYSQNGYGVYGVSEDVWGSGVYGTGEGEKGVGVFGRSGEEGVGVYGYNTTSMATPSATNKYLPGVYGYSQRGSGVYGRTSSTYHYAGWFENANGIGYPGLYVRGNLAVNGNISATGSKVGYVVDIAYNDGPDSLEAGDLVTITGYGEPVLGTIPLIHVSKNLTQESSALVGVVDQPYVIQSFENELEGATNPQMTSVIPLEPEDGAIIVPGEYLSVVTHGAFKFVKADASGGPIVPGSLLVASSEPGHAMAADSPACGTVIGKALGALDSGTGLIPVMVTLQ